MNPDEKAALFHHHLSTLDRIEREATTILNGGDNYQTIEASHLLLKVIDSRASHLGLNAPRQVEVQPMNQPTW